MVPLVGDALRSPSGVAARAGRRACVLVLAATLIAGCGAVSSPSPSPVPSAVPASPAATAEVQRGGTLRVVVVEDPTTGVLGNPPPSFLDPQTGYNAFTAELWRCCLVRTLVSYNGRSTAEGGSRLQPDLAAELPEISADGLTWTFHLKEGLHYGPPLEDVEITARDFIRGIHRAVAPQVVNQEAASGGIFLPSIVGVWAYMAGEAASISGLEAPDDHTLVMHLTEDARDGDFGTYLAHAAAMPLPPDPLHPDAPFGIAEGADTGFGRILVSSGPYMLEGSEQLDLSVPAADRVPAAGIGRGTVTLVRNPSWEPASDALRPAFPDRIEIRLADTMEQAVAALDAGTADLVWPHLRTPPSIPAEVMAAFGADPARGRAHLDATPIVRNLLINLAVPPFDDIHVRKALNLAIDKQRIVELLGGSAGYAPIGHLVADALEDSLLLDYDPYSSPGSRGDVAAARAEIARSRYDTDGDGRCDAAVCQQVRALTREPYGEVSASIADDLAALGINLQVDVVERAAFVESLFDPRQKVPLGIGVAFGNFSLGAGPTLFAFDRHTMWDFPAAPPDTANGTLVGATPEELERWGYEVTEVPSVEDRVDACFPLVGAARFGCAAALDQYLMENVVPLVPLVQDRYSALTSPRVLRYGYDELIATTSLDQLALAP